MPDPKAQATIEQLRTLSRLKQGGNLSSTFDNEPITGNYKRNVGSQEMLDVFNRPVE